MNVLKESGQSSAVFASDVNMSHGFHRQNLMMVGWVVALFLSPFLIHSFRLGRYQFGALVMLIMIISVVNSVMIKKKNRQPIPSWCLLIIIHFVLLYGMTMVGFGVLYWYYPLFFVVFFVNERFSACLQIILAAAILVPYAYSLYDFGLVTRFSMTLLMLCYLSDLLVGLQSKLQLQLTELSLRDPLTNAFNRRHMNSCIQAVIEETKRGLGPVSMLLLDIDFFKKINDSFGHEAGDRVLKKLVDILHKRQRRIDYVFRTGGEEFVILLRNTKLKQAVLIAEDLRKHIVDADWIEGQNITISLGAAQYKLNESDDEWIKRVDDNMYDAKKQGRNTVRPIIDDLS